MSLFLKSYTLTQLPFMGSDSAAECVRWGAQETILNSLLGDLVSLILSFPASLCISLFQEYQ